MYNKHFPLLLVALFINNFFFEDGQSFLMNFCYCLFISLGMNDDDLGVIVFLKFCWRNVESGWSLRLKMRNDGLRFFVYNLVCKCDFGVSIQISSLQCKLQAHCVNFEFVVQILSLISKFRIFLWKLRVCNAISSLLSKILSLLCKAHFEFFCKC